ncbi:GntR family transcriptional regulator [Nonomuraea sp. NPDC049480]|uniref:GntR family transcriptional regulator n=1 Tax=Nonomuraea sp. NPDC049480 TaxID=3364353 RepID=UPI0037B72138
MSTESRIRNGTYRARQPIPSETQLVGEFGIARDARKVVAALREEGLIYTVPQTGSFVSPPKGE